LIFGRVGVPVVARAEEGRTDDGAFHFEQVAELGAEGVQGPSSGSARRALERAGNGELREQRMVGLKPLGRRRPGDAIGREEDFVVVVA
jgi:hypothetical protein